MDSKVYYRPVQDLDAAESFTSDINSPQHLDKSTLDGCDSARTYSLQPILPWLLSAILFGFNLTLLVLVISQEPRSLKSCVSRLSEYCKFLEFTDPLLNIAGFLTTLQRLASKR